jgi:hypothetical protein
MALYDSSSGEGYINKPPFTGASATSRSGYLSNPWLTSVNPVYSTLPVPFQNQNPANFQWPSQVTGLEGMAPDYTLASSWQWNIAVEREIVQGIRLEASYQGNSSTNTPAWFPTNMPVWADGATDSSASYQARRPNQFLGDDGLSAENVGRSRWDQILLLMRARRSGLFAQLSWAYTHGRRNYSGGPTNPNLGVGVYRDWDSSVNFPNSLGLMQDFENDQTIQGFFVWELPFLRHDTTAKGKILGGWSLTANGYWTFLAKGGTVFAGYDANANNRGDDFAKVVGGISYPKTAINQPGSDLLYQWFDPSAFAYPNGTLNRVFSPTTTTDGLNAIGDLPGAWRVDAGLFKDFRIAGDAKLQLRLEAFNLFNHANLNWPNMSVNNPDFGKIRGKYGEGRRFQLGARFMF